MRGEEGNPISAHGRGVCRRGSVDVSVGGRLGPRRQEDTTLHDRTEGPAVALAPVAHCV